MTDIDRVYKITVIEAPELVDIKGLDRSFFEQVSTITEITEHKIEATVTKNRRKEPNQAELTIYNLAPATREQLVRGPMQVRIEAGYDGLLRLLFIGDARPGGVRNEHEGTNWLTKIQLGDGSRAYANAFINRSYQPGTPLTTIIGHMCKSFGVPVPREVTAAPEFQTRIPAGEALVGKVADELTRILAEFGFEWSFQNGQLRIVKADAAFPGTIRLISEGDGMIGTPVIDPPKIRAAAKTTSKARPRVPKLTVQNTLFPELVPAEKFQLQSASLNGTFIIDKLQHELDSFGGDWKSTIEATEAT